MLTVDLHYPNTGQISYLAVLIRHRNFFLRYGVYIRDRASQPFDTVNANIFVVHQDLLTQNLLDGRQPVILAERLDSCTLSTREHAEHPNLKQIWKIATTHPIEIQNEVKGRYHAYLLDGNRSVPKQLSAEALQKLHPAPGYHSYAVLDDLSSEVDLSEPRPISAQFRGTVQYGSPTSREHVLISEHRQKAMGLTSTYPGGVASEKALGRADYFAELRRTKAVVSPWGFGELCYRDFEAMLAGAVLVKPNSKHVVSWPYIFGDNQYVACKPDLSDLVEKIRHVEQNWDQFAEMRRVNREMLLNYRHGNNIADHFSRLLKNAS